MRTFVAVDLPAHARGALEALLQQLGREVPDVRWARSAGIHLTLKFLGEIQEARVPSLAASLLGAASSVAGGFPVAIRRLGTFGDRRSPRVVWVGVEEPAGSLGRLQRAVDEACAGEGFARETRPFSPHLTLARLKAPSRSLGRALTARPDLDLGSFPIERVTLFQSILRPEGAQYVRLRDFPLAAPAGAQP